MGINCGIVGLPNVGKSTLFSALSSAPAEAANYPFCTIDPNVGMVNVPDPRLDKIHELVQADKKVPAIMEFVDIAGLVKGASQGEGLGNQFLSHIRQVGLIAHVVRCFEDDDIVHVDGKISPLDDIEIINIELALADLQTVEKRIEKTQKQLKSAQKNSSAHDVLRLLEILKEALGQGKAARALDFSEEDKALLADLHLITMKKQLYICNVDEEGLTQESSFQADMKKLAEKEGSECIIICGKLEAEIAALETGEEKKEFLEEAGLEVSGLEKLVNSAYHLLGLRTFFTTGDKENKAWTFPEGAKAPQTAGVIHTDFEKGFIKAEVYHCDDLFQYGSEQEIKKAGKLRIEGKDYLVQDGDIMHFRFNN